MEEFIVLKLGAELQSTRKLGNHAVTYEFLDESFHLCQKCCGDFDEDCIVCRSLCEYCQLNNVKSSNPCTWKTFPFNFSSVQSLSCVQLIATPWTAECQASLSITDTLGFPKSQQSWFQLVLHPAQCFSWGTLHISENSRVTIYSLDILVSWFGFSLWFHVQFWLLLPDLHTDF